MIRDCQIPLRLPTGALAKVGSRGANSLRSSLRSHALSEAYSSGWVTLYSGRMGDSVAPRDYVRSGHMGNTSFQTWSATRLTPLPGQHPP